MPAQWESIWVNPPSLVISTGRQWRRQIKNVLKRGVIYVVRRGAAVPSRQRVKFLSIVMRGACRRAYWELVSASSSRDRLFGASLSLTWTRSSAASRAVGSGESPAGRPRRPFASPAARTCSGGVAANACRTGGARTAS